MSDLSIAAVIPLYNGARFIEQAIRSVFAQTLPPDEVIVVDDGSSDDGPKIVERLARAHPITLLRKPNGGQSSARNYGVAHAKSALIALLDQDDVWYPRHLETLLKPFQEDVSGNLGWVYTNIDEISESGNVMCRYLLSRFAARHPKRSLVECLRTDMFILPSASLIARKAFEDIGGFDEALCGYEDDDLFLRMYVAGYVNIFIDEPLSQWRMYPTSTSSTWRMDRSCIVYAGKLFQQFPEHARRHLAPRFWRNFLAACAKATGRKDGAMLGMSLSALREIDAFLSPAERLVTAVFIAIPGGLQLASAAYRMRRFIRPLTRRFFNPHRVALMKPE